MERITGVFEMVKVEIGNDSGAMEEKPLEKGIMAFGANGSVSLNQRSAGLPLFSYLGTTTIQGDQLSIAVIACSHAELEGTTVERRIESWAAPVLVLSGVGSQNKKPFRITWKRV